MKTTKKPKPTSIRLTAQEREKIDAHMLEHSWIKTLSQMMSLMIANFFETAKKDRK